LINNIKNIKMDVNGLNGVNQFNELNFIKKYNGLFESENYNDAIQNVINDKVTKLYIDNDYKKIISVEDVNGDNVFDLANYHTSTINPITLPNLINKASEHNVHVDFADLSSTALTNILHLFGDLFSFATVFIPFYIMLSLFYTFSGFSGISNRPSPPSNNNSNKPLGGGGNQNRPFNFFQQKEEKTDFIKPNVSLNSWTGSPEVIDECKEIISYIESKENYKKIGAEMPKGILLEGPPGTGKTLLAKAIATETNSTFISISGSEFVELYVGMGASRVRELFDNARNNKPSIIFIDEIDAVGRQRGAGINMANDEREQTLNQLLYEMDGFNNNDDIVVMAATNRKDVLDQALLRPGRFDRIIRVPVPDKESREKILNLYLINKKTDKEFDISAISELTEGFSGAELKNLINEAAILSVRNNETVIKEQYVFEAFEKSIVGLIKKNANVSEETRTRVSIHETGHALLALKFGEYFDFQKVSIQPTYNGAGGYTIFSEKADIKQGGLYTKDLLKKRLVIILGGKAAESIYYGNDKVSLGAIEDLRQANKLAQRMVGNFGMGDNLEVFFNEHISDESNPFLGRSLAIGDKYSEYTKIKMDKESLNLVREAYEEAKNILMENKNKMLEFSELLFNSTILYKKDLDDKFVL
jgi:cell division protease FtsH